MPISRFFYPLRSFIFEHFIVSHYLKDGKKKRKTEKPNSFIELKNPPQYLVRVQKIIFTCTVLIQNFVLHGNQKLDMKEIIQTRNEKERERDEIKENNKLLKKIIENDGKL